MKLPASRLSEYLPEVRSRLLLTVFASGCCRTGDRRRQENLIAEIKTTLSTPLVAGQPKQDVTGRAVYRFILR